MKVEQACRFRLDEGYSVFARSPGFQPSQEASLGNIFNSAMNNIFPQVGDSLLTCTTDNTDVFLARNTLRTDIHGRKTMFTHAYIFPMDDYVRMMQETPMEVLGVEMTDLLENQSAGAQMETMEQLTNNTAALDIGALFAKYDLNPTRYSRLLLGAYLALTSDRSLQLVTALPLDQTAPMVREILLCILEGLLPCLKGKITFSSGPDTRMKISVISTANNPSPSGELLFGVEDDRYTNIRPRDEVTEVAFLGIANADDRRSTVDRMLSWLAEAVDINDRLSLTLICTAYCLSSGMALDTMALVKLFLGISQAKSISSKVANALLADLIRRMNAGAGCNEDALSLIAAWYLGDSTEEFRAEADKALAGASDQICVALTDAAFRQEPSENVNLFLKTLLRRVSAGIALTDNELKTNIVLWILRENEAEFAAYASALMENFSRIQQFELAKGILGNGRTRPLTDAEMTMLATALQTLAKESTQLPAEYETLLDAQSPNFSEALDVSARFYLFRVRLANLDAREGLELIDTLRANYPAFFPGILALMAQGAPAVWELYQTRDCFRDDPDAVGLAAILQENNTFHNPNGPFEQEAQRRIETMIRADFVAYPEDKVQMSYYSDPLAKRWFAYTDELNLSNEAKSELCTQIAIIFWEAVTLDQIFSNNRPIIERVFIELPETEEKLLLACLCLELREEAHDAARLVKMATDPDTDENRLQLLRECARKMVFVLLKEDQYLSWDLVMLSCWQQGEKESCPEPKLLAEVFESLDNYFARQRCDFEMDSCSSLLLQEDKLRKSITRLNLQSDTYQKLLEQIKPERSGGLFSFLKGGDKKPAEKKPEKNPEKNPEEKKQRNGRSFFDPTAMGFGDDRRKGKNDK